MSLCTCYHNKDSTPILKDISNSNTMHPLNITNSKIPETFKYPQQSLASILLTETNTYEHRGSKT